MYSPLAGEGLWLWLLAVGCLHFDDTSTALQRHFHGTSTAPPCHFHGPSTAFLWNFHGKKKIKSIGASLCIGRESQCLPYAGFFMLNVLFLFVMTSMSPFWQLSIDGRFITFLTLIAICSVLRALSVLCSVFSVLCVLYSV